MDQTKQGYHTLSVSKKKSLLESALEYAKLGFAIFPCEVKGKAPDGQLVPHGHLEASTDPKLIRFWFKRSPNANIGLVPPKGYAVIDVDPRDGGLETLQALGGAAGTLKAFSGGLDRGHHLWYRYVPHTLPGTLGKGIQLKANGHGYVIAPPSIHPCGGIYAWEDDFDPTRILKWPKGLGQEVMRHEPDRLGTQVKPGAASGDNTLTKSQLLQVLGKIPADDYADWVKVGQAIKADYPTHGFDIWWEWSKKSKKFKSVGDCAKKWETFKGSGVTTGTLVYMAGGVVPKASPEEEFEAVDVAADLLDEKPRQKRGLILKFSGELMEKEIDWLVPNYLAKGMLHCVAGYGGEGKSAVVTAIMAAITQGKDLISGKPLKDGPASILLVTEEPVEYQTLPRLKLSGADIDRIGFIYGVAKKKDEESFNLTDHVKEVRDFFIANPQYKLLVIDPIGSYMTGKATKSINSGNPDVEVRDVLKHWQMLAEELNIVVLFIAHFNKGKSARVVEKVMGSVAFTTTTRRTYMVGKPGAEWLEKFGYSKTPLEIGSDRTMHCIKCNIGREPAPIVFGVDSVEGNQNPKVYVKGTLPLGAEGELEGIIMGSAGPGPREEGDTNTSRMLKAIEESPGLNKREIAKKVNVSEANATRYIDELEEKGKVKRIKNGNETWLYLANDSTLDFLQ